MVKRLLNRHATDERGSTLVEFAIVAGVLFTMVFTGIAFAIIEAGNNAGANAAREGARVATLNYVCADMAARPRTACTSSAALTAITTAVTQHLAGLSAGTPTVTVSCLSGAVSPPTTENCDSSVVVAGVDLVRVTVTWTHLASSPFSSATTQTNSATMVIGGSGVGTSDPGVCIVISGSLSATQASIGNVASGPISSPSTVTVTATTNGLCPSVYLTFGTGVQQVSPTLMTASGATFTFVIDSSFSWSPGTYDMTFTDSSGTAYSISPAPTLTISGSTCSVISSALNPSAVVISGNSSPGNLTEDVTLTVTTSSACTSLSTTFTPNATSGSQVTLPLTGTSSPFALTIAKGAYQWSAGSSQFSLSSGGTALSSGSNGTLLLQINLTCAISVSITPQTTFSHSSPVTLTVTATPATHADCTGLTLTYQYANGNSHIVTTSMSNQGNATSTATIPSTTGWKQGTWTMTFSSNNATSVSTSPNAVQVVAT